MGGCTLSYMFKIINAGDGSVGKTTFLKRYVTGNYIANSIMTIGTGFFTKTLFFDDDRESVQLGIWDFGGQDRFHFFLRDFIFGATAALLFFDLSQPKTFFHVKDWVNLLRSKEKRTENLPILLVGSKCDLSGEIYIEKREIFNAVENYNLIGYIPTSSKENINVDECMNILLESIFKINFNLSYV